MHTTMHREDFYNRFIILQPFPVSHKKLEFQMGGGISISEKEAIELMREEYDAMLKENIPEKEIREKLSALYNKKFVATNENKQSTERSKHLIMISLHVQSMQKSAIILKQFLEAQGFRVWICIDMVGGVNFRTSIVDAVKSCTVFLPLINDSWAQSGECGDEFSLAKRLHLTSHESGRSTREKPRLPIFIPFAFSNLDWNAYPHIQLLAASTNFIVHDAPTLETGNTPKRLDDLLLSMHGAGLPVDLPERLIKSDANEIVLNSAVVTNGPHEQLLAITESLRAFATSIQAFANVASEKEREREREIERKKYFEREKSDDSTDSPLVLSKEYLGVSSGELRSTESRSNGYTMRWWNSFRLEVKKFDSDSLAPVVEGTITETNLRKESTSPSGDEVLNGNDLPPGHPLYQWGKDLFMRESSFKGVFKKDDLLLTCTAQRVREEANGVDNPKFNQMSYQYHLVLRSNELVGVQMGFESVSSLVLKQIL